MKIKSGEYISYHDVRIVQRKFTYTYRRYNTGEWVALDVGVFLIDSFEPKLEEAFQKWIVLQNRSTD